MASRSFEPVIERCLVRAAEDDASAETMRLFHGRGHCYPGYEDLVVDRFGAYLLIACFGEQTDGLDRLAEQLATGLSGVAGVGLQQRRGRQTRTEAVVGQVPDEVVVREAGIRFLVRPLRNQNVGLFLDMAPTRRWLREAAGGKRVLNLFAFTCAFSVSALAGGAHHVVNNDMSAPALEWGRQNHALNDQDPRSVSMVPHNLFKSWWKIRQLGPYDLVIIDPPTNQRGSFVAEKSYGQVLKRLPDICTPGADIVACLNSPFLNADFLPAQMARWCPAAEFESTMPASRDFPDRFPDRALKISRYRLR